MGWEYGMGMRDERALSQNDHKKVMNNIELNYNWHQKLFMLEVSFSKNINFEDKK